MARLNAGYGSELHLLRMLGRHRTYFDDKVCKATGAEAVQWCDFPSGKLYFDKKKRPMWDREWQRLDFLSKDDPAKEKWRRAWPRRGEGHNWDAIGRIDFKESTEWLLVEAKANVKELNSNCGAKDKKSFNLIQRTLDETKKALGVPESCDWTKRYYQYCNRVTALHFLNNAGSAARLLFVYFCGDIKDRQRTCPASADGWKGALADLDRHVALPLHHDLGDRIQKVFINVQCIG